MGSQHVPLTIGDDGLVKSVGTQPQENLYETCVICGEQTNELITTHIDFRTGYVEGCGQLCLSCYGGRTRKANIDINRRMELRRTLIPISAEDIIDRPNDADLGSYVRYIFWQQEKNRLPDSKWVCQYCGGDTSHVDSDYLVNTDHLSCALKEENK